jgi:hypothetical protein
MNYTTLLAATLALVGVAMAAPSPAPQDMDCIFLAVRGMANWDDCY